MTFELPSKFAKLVDLSPGLSKLVSLSLLCGIFLSYQDDGRVIMLGCVQWIPAYSWKDLEFEAAVSFGQHLTK